jgi:hypothetical protein
VLHPSSLGWIRRNSQSRRSLGLSHRTSCHDATGHEHPLIIVTGSRVVTSRRSVLLRETPNAQHIGTTA